MERKPLKSYISNDHLLFPGQSISRLGTGSKLDFIQQQVYGKALDNIISTLQDSVKIKLTGHKGVGKSTMLKLLF